MTTTVINGDDLVIVAQKITTNVVLVNADTAKRWLGLNKRNRPLDEPTVLSYAQQMTDGLWQFAADPIRFDVEGNLIDGQHRLTALALTDHITLPMLVVRGLPVETQKVMDQGRKRTPGNQLALAGMKHANNVAAVARHLLLFDTGLMFRDRKAAKPYTSAAHIESYVEAHPEVADVTERVIRYVQHIDSRPSVLIAFAVLASRRYLIEEVCNFLESTATLASIPVGHPAHTLDRRLRNIRKYREQVTDRDLLALFIQAFNAYTRGRKISQFSRPTGGWNINNFPPIQ